MYLLKQPLSTSTFQSDRASTFAALLQGFGELQLDVEKEDRDKGEIVARCLGRCTSMILWRSWSDKILLEVKRMNAHSTRVSIYAIPNVFRVIAPKNQTITDLNTVASQLAALSQFPATARKAADSK